jgi:hypothetical protein
MSLEAIADLTLRQGGIVLGDWLIAAILDSFGNSLRIGLEDVFSSH